MEYEGLQGASLGERANRLTAAAFDEFHAATAKSTLLRELAALAYGDEYPAEVAPTGMTTWWILGRCVVGLRVGPGERLVDLACGSGSPALWLARAAGADPRHERPHCDLVRMGCWPSEAAGSFAGTGCSSRVARTRRTSRILRHPWFAPSLCARPVPPIRLGEPDVG